MLRLIIVDDEKIIRETISNLIDWASIGIEVVGLCKDGIEAYDMILDEYPDIVMSDIKMPGLSGLELIKRILQTDQNIEFIILSGYGDFSYAKEAMKWGVKHYLLKPCSETQIIEAMQAVTEDCYRKRSLNDFQKKEQSLTKTFRESMIRNIITEGLSFNSDLHLLIKEYERFLDFTNTNYELCYIYYLEEEILSECMELLYKYNNTYSPGIIIYAVYVKNTLLIFFEKFKNNSTEIDLFVKNLNFKNQKTSIQYDRMSFENLNILLHTITDKLKRYEMIYLMNGLHKIPTCNYNSVFQNVEQISHKLFSKAPPQTNHSFSDLESLLDSINNIDLLKALVSNILLKQLSSNSISCSPMHFTEFMSNIITYNDADVIRQVFYKNLSQNLIKSNETSHKYKGFIEKILAYVEENLSNPNLSLKWLVENYLYMNVDYVSKQFVHQTGYKFSIYLTNARIEKAKILLLECGAEKIYSIAEEIGCGNNPQYFSQIFKKHTGLTPTAYVKKMTGEM